MLIEKLHFLFCIIMYILPKILYFFHNWSNKLNTVQVRLGQVQQLLVDLDGHSRIIMIMSLRSFFQLFFFFIASQAIHQALRGFYRCSRCSAFYILVPSLNPFKSFVTRSSYRSFFIWFTRKYTVFFFFLIFVRSNVFDFRKSHKLGPLYNPFRPTFFLRFSIGSYICLKMQVVGKVGYIF